MEPPHSIEEFIGTEIIEERGRYNLLIEEVVDEMFKMLNDDKHFFNLDFIITIDRKGTSIYTRFWQRLLQSKGKIPGHISLKKSIQGVFYIRSNYEIKTENLKNKKVGIVVDAINKGDEIQEIIEVLTNVGASVEIVYAYISKKSTIQKRKKEKILFKSCHEGDEEEYSRFRKNITIFNSSSTEPLDTDHVFASYKIIPEIDLVTLKSMLENFSKELKLEGDITENDLIGELSGNQLITLDVLEPPPSNLPKFPPSLQDYIKTFERLQIRCWVDNHQRGVTKLTLMIFTPPENLNVKKIHDDDFPCQKILKCNFQNKNKLDFNFSLCPMCFENYISGKVLEKFNHYISRFLANVSRTINIQTRNVPAEGLHKPR